MTMIAPVAGTGSGDGSPLSYAQQRLWFLHQLDPEDPAYNVCLALEIRGGLRTTALRQAIAALTRRHGALRTAIVAMAGVPVQVAVDVRDPLGVVDLTGLPDADRAVDGLLRAAAGRPIRLAAGPPARWLLLRTAHRDVLLLAVHHIVFDGQSLAVLAGELGPAYAALGAGCPARLASARRDYPDHVRAEQAGSVAADAALRYWREQLAGAPANVPTLGPGSAANGIRRPAAAWLALGSGRLARLREYARARRCTPYMVVAAVLAATVWRYTGADDVVIGSPVSSRDDPELDRVVGMFVNMLPLRVRLGGDPSLDELVGRVREVVLAGLEHRAAPFERIVADLRPARAVTLSPLFQIQLVYQRPPAVPRLPGVRANLLPVPAAAAKYELTVTVTESDDRCELDLEGAPGSWDGSALAAFGAGLVRLLDGALAAPARPLGAVEPLTAAGREAAVDAGRGASRPRAAGDGLPSLIRRRARSAPDQVAVLTPDSGEHLSRAALGRWSGDLAARLRALGAGPGVRIGVLLDRSALLPAVLLGVLDAGAGYVPLDPADPPARLGWLVADAGIAAVVTTGALRDRVPAAVRNVLEIRAGFADRFRRAWPAPAAHPEQVAYLMYTSGSTGRPKGVLVPHRGIVNRLAWMQEELPLDPGERVLHKAPTTFDVSVWELFWPLIAGGCAVVARPGGHRDPGYLCRLVERVQIGRVHFVPSLLGPFLDAVTAAGIALPALRTIACSGEALPGRLVERCVALPQARLVNLYGPTEASIEVTASIDPAVPVRIGAPIANVSAHVLDPAGEPVADYATGELHLGGVCVAHGYHGRAGPTAVAFRPDPYGPPGGRLYRTGDRARRWPDRSIEYLGRRDDQVKLAGNRIELGEIEETLRALPAVADAAVAVLDRPAPPRLVAYVVPATGDCRPSDVQAELRARLPAVMVPTTVRLMDELPRTASGKLDRGRLRAPADPIPPGPAPAAGALKAESALEQQIAAHWRATLGRDEIGAHESFFDAGGSSMLLLELHSRLVQDVAAGLRVVDLFRFPTVAALAGYLAGSAADLERTHRPAADRAERRTAALAAARSRREARDGG